MAIYLPKSNFTPPPAGTFPAVCYRIIDLGTQPVPFQGEVKHKHRIMLSWELHDDECLTDEGKPMTVHKPFTFSMHPKATLRKSLESWRGKAFEKSDFGEGGFDLSKLVGVPCLIGITHEERDGEVYANITSISKMLKGMKASALQNAEQVVWIDDKLKPEALEKLSENLRTKIMSSPEYKALATGGSDPADDWESGAKAEREGGKGFLEEMEELEEIPF